MSRIVLAMSGGVDSSVAAHLLVRAGHEVIGVFMRHGQKSPVACSMEGGTGEDAAAAPRRTGSSTVSLSLPVVSTRPDHKQGCCTAADAADAARVADLLDIPFYALNLEEEFAEIIDYFVAEYTAGRTPNPCVQCNNWIKFGKLFDYADDVGAEFVATGHYARMGEVAGEPAILRGVDDGKDQAYVLFGIQQRFLSRMMLPVGGFEKPAIRAMAAELGLRVAEKPDSQEICFVTSGKHDQFVRARRGEGESTAGAIVTTDGRELGRHAGIEGFTIGQRKGLGGGLAEPHFVVRIEPETNTVVVGLLAELARDELTAQGCNWHIALPAVGESFPCQAQIRYNSRAQAATATVLADGRLHIEFDSPAKGVAPGQAVVCFDGERVLGGGWIE